MAKIGVLSLQGAVSEHLAQVKRCGAEAAAVKRPADLEELDGLIIPGGESTTIGNLMEQFGLNRAITARFGKGMAIFGTCAGMVLLAKEILDGVQDQPRLALMDIKVRRNAFGRQKESFEAPVSVKGFDTPVTGVFIRAPIITEAGDRVEALATVPEGIAAARQGKLLTTAFHPELTDDLRVHRYFIEICRS
ncbi:MAG: pyridoxal 5'-phosphate synthase glutaminase subunit PdxT [Bacillota bacterium]